MAGQAWQGGAGGVGHGKAVLVTTGYGRRGLAWRVLVCRGEAGRGRHGVVIYMTDEEMLELYNERAGIREFDGLMSLELDRMTPAQRDLHRRAAEQSAYWDLRKLLGDVKLPAAIWDKARKFRPEQRMGD